MLGGRGREDETGVRVTERQHIGKGPGDLAHGLPRRPQPGAVDMGVADGMNVMRADRRRARQNVDQGRPASVSGAADIVRVNQVNAAFEGAQQVRSARGRRRKLAAKALKCPDVLQQAPHRQIT